MAGNILSPEEHRQLTTIPTEIGDAELVRNFTLQPEDLVLINPRPPPIHRFDQAAHICLLRWLGWSPVAVDRLPDPARVALNRQLKTEVEYLEPPAARTSRLHAERAREHLGWHKFAESAEHSLRDWLEPLAEEHDHAHVLFEVACRYLRQAKIVRPGPDRLERPVEMVRTRVKERVAHGIESQLTAAQKNQMDGLLTVSAGEAKSPLQRFKETPVRASGNELLEVLEKIEALRALGPDALDLGAGRIHPNRVNLLARRAKQRTNWVTAQLRPQQRYLMLVCFLDQALHNYVDLAVAMYVETTKRSSSGQRSNVTGKSWSMARA